MREIEFRGKRVSNGEWLVSKTIVRANGGFFLVLPNVDVYGDYKNKAGVTHLCCNRGFLAEVAPETIGQYTGMEDRNGKRIYEGDIVKFEDCGEEGYEYKEGFDFVNTAKVIWNNSRWELDDFLSLNSGVAEEMSNCHEDFVSIFYFSEVIGNIYDNPELLEAQP